MPVTEDAADRARRNRRLAWILGGFVLFVFLLSVPFWLGIARIIGDQAG